LAYVSGSDYTRGVLAVLIAARAAGIPVILWGAPGTGKTSLIYALGESEGLLVKLLLGSTMDPTDLSGLPALKAVTDGEGQHVYNVTENTVPQWGDELIQAGKGILFADELNNSTPTVQSGLLTLLQDKKIGNRKLPDDVWILAASNEPEDAADGYELAPPLANRLLHIQWNPPKEDWFDGMLANWGDNLASAEQVQERSKIVAFLKNYPNLLQAQPKTDAAAGKAWPSRRSWDNAAKALAAAPNNDTIRNMILTGLIGEEASVQFFKWEKSLSLPSHESVLNNPEALDWKAMRADVALTILNRVVAFVRADNLKQSVNVFVAAKHGTKGDIASSLMVSFLGRVKEQKLDVSALSPLIKDMADLMVKSGMSGAGNQ